MKRRLSFVLPCGILGLLSMGCLAGEVFPDAFGHTTVSRFRPSANAYYGPLTPAAKLLVIAEKKNRHRQHFCAIGYHYDSGAFNVWVHWKEAQRLILWRGGTDPDAREHGLAATNRDLKLGKDTVKREEDLNGSTYMVTRAWWEAVASDCAANGEMFTLAPFAVDKK